MWLNARFIPNAVLLYSQNIKKHEFYVRIDTSQCEERTRIDEELSINDVFVLHSSNHHQIDQMHCRTSTNVYCTIRCIMKAKLTKKNTSFQICSRDTMVATTNDANDNNKKRRRGGVCMINSHQMMWWYITFAIYLFLGTSTTMTLKFIITIFFILFLECMLCSNWCVTSRNAEKKKHTCNLDSKFNLRGTRTFRGVHTGHTHPHELQCKQGNIIIFFVSIQTHRMEANKQNRVDVPR